MKGGSSVHVHTGTLKESVANQDTSFKSVQPAFSCADGFKAGSRLLKWARFLIGA